MDTFYVYVHQIQEFSNLGIEELMHKINKLKKIDFLQFLKS
jgi:hypothetical protein